MSAKSDKKYIFVVKYANHDDRTSRKNELAREKAYSQSDVIRFVKKWEGFYIDYELRNGSTIATQQAAIAWIRLYQCS
jgi:hypothetical protein